MYNGTFPSRFLSIDYLKRAELPCNSGLGTPYTVTTWYLQNIPGLFTSEKIKTVELFKLYFIKK
jgi:hypothetical protein